MTQHWIPIGNAQSQTKKESATTPIRTNVSTFFSIKENGGGNGDRHGAKDGSSWENFKAVGACPRFQPEIT
jgi:hypothetical protein